MEEIILGLNRRRKIMIFLFVLMIGSFFFPFSLIMIDGFVENNPGYFVFLLIGPIVMFSTFFIVYLVRYQAFRRKFLYPVLTQSLWNYHFDFTPRKVPEFISQHVFPWRVIPSCDYSISLPVGQTNATWHSIDVVISTGKASTVLFDGLVLAFPLPHINASYARLDRPQSRFGSKSVPLNLVKKPINVELSSTIAPWDKVIPIYHTYQQRKYKHIIELIEKDNKIPLMFSYLERDANSSYQENQLSDLYERIYRVIPSPVLSLVWTQGMLYVAFNDGIDPLNIRKYKAINFNDLESSQTYLQKMDEVINVVKRWSEKD